LKDRLPSVRTPLFALLVVLFSKAGAKVLLFSDIRKFFGKKMQKKCKKVYFMPNQGMQAGLWRALKRAFGGPTDSPHASIQTIGAKPIRAARRGTNNDRKR